MREWLKVGMTLYYAEGPKIVQTFKQLGFNVFLDLKFHDIPHQVEGAAASAVLSGADMLTMHAVGGSAMMAAGHRGAEAAAFERKVPVPATLADHGSHQHGCGIACSYGRIKGSA